MGERMSKADLNVFVLNTRSKTQAAEFSEVLAGQGVEVLEFPALELLPELSKEDRGVLTASYEPPAWLIVTSANGITTLPPDIDLSRFQIACLGEKSAQALLTRMVEPAYVGSGTSSSEFADELLEYFGAEVTSVTALLVRGDIADEALPQKLRFGGANLVEISSYKSVAPELDPAVVAQLRASLARRPRVIITFTSSQAARNFRTLLDQAGLSAGERATVLDAVAVVVGPKTAATASSLGFVQVVTAPSTSIEAMAAAVAEIVGS